MREVDGLSKKELEMIKNGEIGIIECSATELRDYLDGDTDKFADVEHILDAAQGNVYTGEQDVQLVVLRVVAGDPEEGDEDEDGEGDEDETDDDTPEEEKPDEPGGSSEEPAAHDHLKRVA